MTPDDAALSRSGLPPRGRGRILIIGCGALAREILALIELNGLSHVDLTCLPAILHNRPERIAPALEEAITRHAETYDRIFVAYADCGSGGAIAAVCERHGVGMIPGPHCYSFFEGNAAFAINGPWYLATLNEKDVNYEVTTLPKPEGGEVNPYTGITMWYFSKGMSQENADTKAAREFIEWYVTNEDHLLSLAKKQGSIPVLAELVGSNKLPAEVQAFSQMVERGTPMPTRPRVNKVWSAMETALIKAFNGDATAKAALNGAAKTARSNWN